MSRGTLRTLLAGLCLALVLALAAPLRAEAAGFRDWPLGRTLLSFAPRWLAALFEKSGYQIDPNGSPAPPHINGDGGYAIDPNG
jgi:hypothetical protein